MELSQDAGREEKAKGKRGESLFERCPNTVASLAVMGATGIMMNAMLGGIGKMFGDTEKIPQGVVREMIQGVMDGLISHFQGDINELKYDNDELKKELDKTIKQNEELESEIVTLKALKAKLEQVRRPKKRPSRKKPKKEEPKVTQPEESLFAVPKIDES